VREQDAISFANLGKTPKHSLRLGWASLMGPALDWLKLALKFSIWPDPQALPIVDGKPSVSVGRLQTRLAAKNHSRVNANLVKLTDQQFASPLIYSIDTVNQ
jgi:hypothetical protein